MTSSTGITRTPTVSVVVPALNEEPSIGWVIENLPAWVSEVVLVDGLSIDGTELAVVAQRSDAVIVHQRTRGKGAALRAGFAAASGDIIVTLDADGSTDPREMRRYVDALLAGADVVTGSRNLGGGGSLDTTRLSHLANRGVVRAANLLFGAGFTDLGYGSCAVWRRNLTRLALTADGSEITLELVLSAIKAGLRITEVPAMELPRRAGPSSPHARRGRRRALRTLISERIRPFNRARAAAAAITLIPALVPAHSSEHWLPAGSDSRSWAEQQTSGEMGQVLVAVDAGNRRLRPVTTFVAGLEGELEEFGTALSAGPT